MELIRVADAQEAGRIAAALIASRALEGEASIALPGGRSVASTYDALSACSPAVLSNLRVRIADERIAADERNGDVIREHLISPAAERGIAVDFREPVRDLPKAGIVRSYEDTIDVDTFDIVLASSGEDGHALGLYPGFPQLDSTEKIEAFDDSPKPPAERMTTTFACYDAERTLAIVLFLGEGKREALGRFLVDPPYHELPVARFGRFTRCFVITDQQP